MVSCANNWHSIVFDQLTSTRERAREKKKKCRYSREPSLSSRQAITVKRRTTTTAELLHHPSSQQGELMTALKACELLEELRRNITCRAGEHLMSECMAPLTCIGKRYRSRGGCASNVHGDAKKFDDLFVIVTRTADAVNDNDEWLYDAHALGCVRVTRLLLLLLFCSARKKRT